MPLPPFVDESDLGEDRDDDSSTLGGFCETVVER